VLAAEAEVRNSRADEALALLEELSTEIRASGLRWHEAELLRVSGEARLSTSPANKARARLNCARRYRWRSSIIRSAALSKPKISSPA